MKREDIIKIDIRDKELLESLSELEHLQWISFSQSLLKIVEKARSLEELKNHLSTKWNKNWISYKDLSNKEKSKDRLWAVKTLQILKDKSIDSK